MGLGQAANFGFATDAWYVEVNGKSDPADGPLSLAAWFKTTVNGGSLTAVHGAGDTSGDAALLAVVLGRPSTLLGDGGSDPGANALVHAEDLADGQWHHMAMTFTGGEDDTLKLFVDGVLSGIRTQAAGDIHIDGWEVGKKYGGTAYFAGSMDDVRMYDRALSDGGVSIVGQTAGGDVANLYARVIPEPGTVVLLGTGLLALTLAAWARRRERNSSG